MVIPGHTLGNSQVSVNRTIGTLVLFTDKIRCSGVSRPYTPNEAAFFFVLKRLTFNEKHGITCHFAAKRHDPPCFSFKFYRLQKKRDFFRCVKTVKGLDTPSNAASLFVGKR